MNKIKMKLLRPLLHKLIHVLGSDIIDARTSQPIGRALLLPWRGRIIVLGPSLDLVPCFCPDTRMIQWKRTLAFTRHPAPDYPHEPRP